MLFYVKIFLLLSLSLSLCAYLPVYLISSPLYPQVDTVFNTLEHRHAETKRTHGKKDSEYWQKLTTPLPEDRLRVWKGLEIGLGRMKEALEARQTMQKENDSIRKQNEELRQLLHQQLQAKENGALQEPPRDALHYGPP